MVLPRMRAHDHRRLRGLRALPPLTDDWNEPPRQRDVPWPAAVISLLGLAAAIVGARVLQGSPSGDGSGGLTTAAIAESQYPAGPEGDGWPGIPVPAATTGTATIAPVAPATTPPAGPTVWTSVRPATATATPVRVGTTALPSRSPSPPSSSSSPSSSSTFSRTGGCSATYKVDSVWSTGFIINITLTNTSSTGWRGWSGGFQAPDGVTVQSSWGATMQGTGRISMTSVSWSGDVPPGGTVTFGFQGNAPGPSAARISGISVQGSTCATG